MFLINQLIVIGGPSCAGKTFLIEQIQQGSCPDLCKQLGITDPTEWTYIQADGLVNIQQSVVDRLVIHYDFYTQYSQTNNRYNHLFELVDHSKEVTVLTLYVPQKTLLQRNIVRFIDIFKTLIHSIFSRTDNSSNSAKIQKIKRLWKKQKAYKKGISQLLYEEWFKLLSQTSLKKHWVLDFEKSPDTMIGWDISSFWKTHNYLTNS